MKRPVFALMALLALVLAAYRGYAAVNEPASRGLSASIAAIALLLAVYFGYRFLDSR